MRARQRHRTAWIGSWVAVVASTAVLLAPWSAAADDVEATLSDLGVTDSAVTGTLILRSEGGQSIDTSSLTAEVGGEPADVRVVGVENTTRRTMLVIDTSGSMGSAGMATVRRAVGDFLREVPADVEVGVVSFATTAGIDVPPTTDRDRVQREVNGLRSRGETALYAAVQEAVRGLGTEGERSIVLLSDGGDTVAEIEGGPEGAATERANAVAALTDAKVRAEVVAFTSDEARDDVLQEFADAGGGSVATATDPDAVSAAFSAAARTLESQVGIEVATPEGQTGRVTLVVDGTASGVPFTADSAVDLGAPPPVTPTPSPSPSREVAPPVAAPAPSTGRATALLLPLAAGACFLGIFGLGVATVAPPERSSRRRRVAEIGRYASGQSGPLPVVPGPTPSALSAQLIHVGDRVMQGREATSRTLLLLDRADLPWRAGEWLVLRSLAVVIGGLVGYLVLATRSGVVGTLLGLLVGFVAPVIFLRGRASRRARRFEVLLPDVFTLVATSLSSGFSLRQSLDAVAGDMPEPAAKEFSRALAETLIGADIPDVLDRVALRMGSDNLRWAVMAIRIQQDVGGNLAETLRTTAATLREREMLKRQVQSLSAEGRLSAYILIALPLGLFAYMFVVNHDYLSLLWTSGAGILMLVLAAVAMVAGIFWMRAVVRIEV